MPPALLFSLDKRLKKKNERERSGGEENTGLDEGDEHRKRKGVLLPQKNYCKHNV